MTAQTKDKRPSDTPDRLTTPIEFEDARGDRISRRTMRVALAFTAVALVWAAAAPIRELSLARGQLIPSSQVRPVQHLEGGIVERIMATEGQIVEKDQPLLLLNAATAESEFSTLKVRAQNLLLQKERDEALLAGRPVEVPNIGEVGAAQAAEHLQAYRLQLDHRTKERHLLLTRIDQRKAELAGLRDQSATQSKLMDFQKQQLDAQRVLAGQGAGSRHQLLEAAARYEEAHVAMQVTQGKLAATEEALKEAEAALAESSAKAQKQWSDELTKASSELIEVQESMKKYADRVERLTVRAPARGRVQQMLQRSPGEVVKAGETIALIVPTDDALMAEVLVKPEDIAAVKPSDKAELKVTAYDFSKYGKFKGEVADISPTTSEQEDKHAYYKVHIRLDGPRSDRFASVWQLQPGMTVDAEIVSGSKSLLQYLLKPIYRGVDAAFAER
jgi:HlyD family secretion protein/adhesin transport system membrane fusion protein